MKLIKDFFKNKHHNEQSESQKNLSRFLKLTNKNIYFFLNSNLKSISKKGKISSRLAKEYFEFDKISKFLLSGKRIRSSFIFTSATLIFKNKKITKKQFSLLSQFACIIEIIHSASLIHDDVIDNSDFRRGKKTINSQLGSKHAILIGDFLISETFDYAGKVAEKFKIKEGKIFNIISKVISDLSFGEIMQSGNTGKITSKEKYIKIITMKTGSLFSAAANLVAIVTRLDTKNEVNIINAGKNFGILFQINDDVLDCNPKECAAIGKQPYTDISQGKSTIPLIYSKKLLSKKDWNTLKDIFDGKKAPFDDIQNKLLSKDVLNAISECKQKYQKEILESFKKIDVDDCSEIIEIIEKS